MHLKSYPILILLFAFQPYLLSAQETTSEISGIISADNKPLEGAVITATHIPSGTKYKTASRKDGRYNLAELKIGGPYTLSVTNVGYEPAVQENIILLLGQTFHSDFTLHTQIKSLSHVTVTANKEKKIFSDNHTGTQEIISSSEIKALPTTTRTVVDYVKLVPFSRALNIGGTSYYYNNFTVDGARYSSSPDYNGALGLKIYGQPVSIETVDQLQVLISPYDVRNGNFVGAGINAVTKSGSNQFTASLYTYFASSGSTENEESNNQDVFSKNKYNTIGLNLGGPIVKNKLFYFINFEQESRNMPGSNYRGSDSLHAPGGNISLANADTLTELRNFLIQKFHYDPGAFQEYYYHFKKYKFSIKTDWNINNNNKLSIKYNYYTGFEENPLSNAGAPLGDRQAGATALPFATSGYKNINNYHLIIAELNSSLSRDAVNKLQIGYKTLNYYRESLGDTLFPFVDILNGQGQAYTSFGLDPHSYNNSLQYNILQIADLFTIYKGKHAITIGTQNVFNYFSRGYFPFFPGYYRFNSLTDFYNSTKHDAPSAARYNIRYATNKDSSFPSGTVKSNEFGFFLQDKLSFEKTFSLYYGLRVDLPVFMNNAMDNPDVNKLTFADNQHYSTSAEPKSRLLFSPRIGFNWNIKGNSNMQLRGGGGIFTGEPPYIWLSNASVDNGAQFANYNSRKVKFSPDIAHYIPHGRPQDYVYSLVLTDPNLKYPQAFKSNLAIDKKFKNDLILTLEALYTKNINDIFFKNVNLPSSGTYIDGLNNRFRFDKSRIYDGQPQPSAANPYIGQATLITNSNKGYSYGLTVQAQKTVANFDMSISYTYSKIRTLGDLSPIVGNIWTNKAAHNNPNVEELAYPSYSQPHRVMAYAGYTIDYGKIFSTTIGLFFESATWGVGSYTYLGDLNNDGVYSNDLIYIPKEKNDIILVPVNTGYGPVRDNRTPDQIWAQLDNFIKQDKYLNSHRGKNAERNAVVLPYYHNIGISITQDFNFTSPYNTSSHTLSVSINILNFLNLLNKSWETQKAFSTYTYAGSYLSSILQFEGIAPDGSPDAGKPRFSFPYLDPDNEIPLTNSFTTYQNSYLSAWTMQIGLRYTFR